MLFKGDCRDFMVGCEPETFHAIVTDPPYHLTSVVKRFGKPGSAPARHGTDGLYARHSRGFMGKEWDGGGIAFDPATWALAWDCLKPGGHLVAFGGTRTHHRMACAIEDAGFEIRDCLMWIYGTGFPKSHDVSKGIDKAAGAEREIVGQHERINFRGGGAGFRNLDGLTDGDGVIYLTAPATPEAAAWEGWGTALKPAWEPIVLARKPLIGTVAANVLAHGTGALNIDACRIPGEGVPLFGHKDGAGAAVYGGGFNGSYRAGEISHAGRWPANVVHDGSGEVEGAFAAFGGGKSGAVARHNGAFKSVAKGPDRPHTSFGYADSGTASRFFYSAKASKTDRAGSKHPTIKPLALMRWLVGLVCPPGGHVLDPFAGSGSTLRAALDLGMQATGCEMDPEYQGDIERRLGLKTEPTLEDMLT